MREFAASYFHGLLTIVRSDVHRELAQVAEEDQKTKSRHRYCNHDETQADRSPFKAWVAIEATFNDQA